MPGFFISENKFRFESIKKPLTMKQLVIVLPLLFSFFISIGQSNQDSIKKYLPKNEDKVTGVVKYEGKKIILKNKEGHTLVISVSTFAGKSLFFISFQIPGMGCVDQMERIRVLYKDGSREVWKNGMEYNCNEIQIASFEKDSDCKLDYETRISEAENADKLLMDIIRVSGSNRYFDFQISKKQAMLIRNQFKYIRVLAGI